MKRKLAGKKRQNKRKKEKLENKKNVGISLKLKKAVRTDNNVEDSTGCSKQRKSDAMFAEARNKRQMSATGQRRMIHQSKDHPKAEKEKMEKEKTVKARMEKEKTRARIHATSSLRRKKDANTVNNVQGTTGC